MPTASAATLPAGAGTGLQKLEGCIASFTRAEWSKVAALVGQSPEACRTHWWSFCRSLGSNCSAWTSGEDAELQSIAQKHKERNVSPTVAPGSDRALATTVVLA